MICPLYALQEKYKDKKIYVWNVNRTSMLMYLKIFLMRIDISGFVAAEEEYVGETYMNRPVVSIKSMLQEENSLVLVADEVPEEKISAELADRRVYWADALGINEELRKNRVILYGTGHGADEIEEILSQEGVETELYCVTKKEGVTQYKGKRVIEAVELEKYGDYSVVISVKREQYQMEILETLSAYQGQIFVEHIFNQQAISQVDIIQNIDFAIKESKKIYMYGKRTVISELIEEALRVYGIGVSGYVYDIEDEGQNIGNIYELALESTEDKLIIINEIFPQRFVEARENIEQAGFVLEKRCYIGFQYYTASNEYLLSKLKMCFDPLVGVSILYSDGRPGWKIYGKEEDDRIRIMVLGGSTSSEIYYPENWVSKLYYKLESRNIKTVIYNGAHAGNDIVEEVLRFWRDAVVLRPQIVISMSGVNNTLHKDSENQFNSRTIISWVQSLTHGREYCSGLYSEESLYDFWNRNVEILKLVAGFYGAELFAFLQPMNIAMKHMTLWEKSVYEMEHHARGAEEFAEAADDDNGYINLMSLFEHQNEMYMDMCHYTDKAHEIIADRVCEAVMPVLQAKVYHK